MTPTPSDRDSKTHTLPVNRRNWLRGIASTALASGVGLTSAGTVAGQSDSPTTLNVKEYGAVGDGVTDDRAAIESAINDADDGDTVFIPATDEHYLIGQGESLGGIYIDGSIADNVTIEGEGPGSFLMLGDMPDQLNVMLFTIGSGGDPIVGLTIKKLHLSGNEELNEGVGGTGHGAILFLGEGYEHTIHLEDILITDNPGLGISLGTRANGTETVTGHRITIDNTIGQHAFQLVSGDHEGRVIHNEFSNLRVIDPGHALGQPGNAFNIAGHVRLTDAYVENAVPGSKISGGNLYTELENIRFTGHEQLTTFRETASLGPYTVVMDNIRFEDQPMQAMTFGGQPGTLYEIGDIEFQNVNNAELDDNALVGVNDPNVEIDNLYLCDTPENGLWWSSNGTAEIGSYHHYNVGGDLVANETQRVAVESFVEEPCPGLDVPERDEVGAFTTKFGTEVFEISIDSTNAPVEVVDPLTVDVTVHNTGDETGIQDVSLAIDGDEVDTKSVALAVGHERTITLSWETSVQDVGSYTATVSSADTTASSEISVDDRAVFSPEILTVTEAPAGGDAVDVTASITNIGGEPGDDEIALAIDDTVVASNDMSLDAGDTEELTLTWDSNTADVGARTITVRSSLLQTEESLTILEPASFTVESISASSPVEAGTAVPVAITVANSGEATATQDIDLEALDEIVDTGSIEIAGGTTAEMTLSWIPDEAAVGTWMIAAHAEDGSEEMEIEVVERTVVKLELWSINTPIYPGETLEIEVGLTNPGDVPATRDIRLKINGEEVDVVTTTIGAGSVTSVALAWASDEIDTGEFEVTVRSDQREVTEFIQIGDPDDEPADDDTADDTADDANDTTGAPGDEADDTENDGLPGFGIGSAIASLVGGGYLLKQRLEDPERGERG